MEDVVPTGSRSEKPVITNTTVYVKRLQERIDLKVLEELLRGIFSQFGPITTVQQWGSLRRKGQAYITFETLEAAEAAVNGLDGFKMHGRNIIVEKARMPSDANVRQKGSAEQFEAHKKHRLTLKERKLAEEASKAQALPQTAVDKPKPVKTGAAAVPDEYVRPNKTLVVKNIPAGVEQEDLTAIFDRFEGFREVRFFAVKHIAFVEFADEQFAITAKEATANMPVGPDNKPIKVTYQRKKDAKVEQRMVNRPKPTGPIIFEDRETTAPAATAGGSTQSPFVYEENKENSPPAAADQSMQTDATTETNDHAVHTTDDIPTRPSRWDMTEKPLPLPKVAQKASRWDK